MNDFSKTSVFVVFAAAMLGLAGWTWNVNKPVGVAGYEDQGKSFFPGLERDNVELQALEIHAQDGEGNLQEFIVRKKNGVWSIPSHYNYPAEAAERLASSISALNGLVREAVDSRSRADHEKRGVLDPLDPDVLVPETAGKRITIRGAGDVILADLIIGKKVESVASAHPDTAMADQPEDLFFVRAANETTIYRIPLNLEISTRFPDWINTSLLELGETTPLAMTLDSYAIVEQKDQLGRTLQLVKKPAERLQFSRPDAFGAWQLRGIRPDVESIKTAEVNNVLRTAESLEIRGVRPKFTWQGEQLITPDLKLNQSESLLQDPKSFQQAILHLQEELAERGFNLIPGEGGPGSLSLVSENGELELGCDDGLKYTLYFGKSVTGDEKSIEIGDSTAEIEVTENLEQPAANPENANPSAADNLAAEETAQANAEKSQPVEGDEANNRFVMIRVTIDETLLSPAPTAPIEPEAPPKPEGYVPAPAVADPSGAGGEQKSDVQETARDPRFVEFERLQAVYEQIKSQHELDLMRFNDEIKAREEKRTVANNRSKDLNVRFGAWYYVVSASNLEKLQAKRAELVEPSRPDPNAPKNLPDVPDISFEDQ